MKYINPDPKKCNVDAFVACSLGAHIDNYWDSLTTQCAYNNGCNVKFADLRPEEQAHVAEKFMANTSEMQFATSKL